jgi:hypothetical protein
VLHHEQSGRIVEAVLRYAAVSNDLQLYSRQDGIFMSKETVIVSPLLLFSSVCAEWVLLRALERCSELCAASGG